MMCIIYSQYKKINKIKMIPPLPPQSQWLPLSSLFVFLLSVWRYKLAIYFLPLACGGGRWGGGRGTTKMPAIPPLIVP